MAAVSIFNTHNNGIERFCTVAFYLILCERELTIAKKNSLTAALIYTQKQLAVFLKAKFYFMSQKHAKNSNWEFPKPILS